MGDGHIKRNKSGLQFFFREKADAELFKEEFLSIFKNEKMKLSKKEYCYMCEISSRDGECCKIDNV